MNPERVKPLQGCVFSIHFRGFSPTVIQIKSLPAAGRLSGYLKQGHFEANSTFIYLFQ